MNTPEQKKKKKPDKNWFKNNAGSLILFGVLTIFLYAMLGGSPLLDTGTKNPDITQLISDVKAGKVETILDNGEYAEATYKKTDQNEPAEKISYVKKPYESVLEILQKSDIENIEDKVSIVNKEPSGLSRWLPVISTIGPILLTIFIVFFLFRQMSGGGGAFSFGKSKARLFDGKGAYDNDKKRPISFLDVAGIDEAKQELVEVVEFLKNPKKFTDIGARIPHGVLLIGPPGTGKTLLAKAVAGEAKVPFFSISGSEFVEMFVGVGASRARDLFEQAKKSAPCIIFIDEIDAVGRQRGAGMGGGHDEREQTLNQILVEMDGFDSKSSVIVMAATNRPDVLDPALLRPGRFDRQVVIQKSDIKGREAILNVHISDKIKKHLDKKVNLEVIAKQTPGFTGADLRNLVNEAAILAARDNRKKITLHDFEEAIDRVMAGPARKSKIITPEQKKLTAFHELGHAIVGHYLPDADPVHKISIISRGMMGGYTRFLPKEDRDNYTKAQFTAMIASLLAGYAMEKIEFGDVSTGASNDIERATSLAKAMVTKYGMSSRFGPIAIGGKEEMVFLGKEIASKQNFSNELAAQVDDEIHKIISAQLKVAEDILKKHHNKVKKLAVVLMEKEAMTSDEFEKLLSGKKNVKKTVKRIKKKKAK